MFMFALVNMTSSRMLVGPRLCRNREWLGCGLGYATEAKNIANALRPRPQLLRPFIYMTLPARPKLHAHIATAKRLLKPELEAIFAGEYQELTALRSMADLAEPQEKNLDRITLKMLFLTLAAIVTVVETCIHGLYDLCGDAQYVEPLRAEIDECIAKHGWTLPALNEMKKLDSFLKETMRLNSLGLCQYWISN
jgi:hypothetical protein